MRVNLDKLADILSLTPTYSALKIIRFLHQVIMGLNPQTETSPTSPSHLYSQELQLKLYQAFIFSIPILFSIILFLLFYLFYLKRRVSSITSSDSANHPPQNSDRRAAVGTSSADGIDLEEICKEKLPVILYDENSKSRETLCCVCLGEYEVKDELHQIPSCKHVFHIDCITHWLHSNSTCPLCRSPVLISTTNAAATTTTFAHETIPSAGNDHQPLNQIPGPRMVYAEQPQQLAEVVLRVEVCASEGSSGSSSRHIPPDESLVVISIQS